MLWLNFFHLYQPVNTDGHIIKDATVKSYLRIIRAMEEHPDSHFTFNITGGLFLRWQELGYKDIPVRLKKLIDCGRLEITGTAAYHPILPLIPEEEAKNQIKTNEKILKEYLGKDFKPKGFFLPEMAYSPKISILIKKLGYKWLILDDFSARPKPKDFDLNKIYTDKASGIKIIFRSRNLSNSFVPATIIEMSKNDDSEKTIAITATDAELYGLRHEDQTGIFEASLSNKNIHTSTFSEFIERQKPAGKIDLIKSTWETDEKDLKNNTPYPLWFNSKNDIQMKLWELADFSYKIVKKHKNDPNYFWAYWHLIRGFASCTFWWASKKDFRKVFGPISWNPDEIERGTNELIRAVRSLDSTTTRSDKIKAEKLYIKIKQMVWQKHWTYYWKK